MSSYSRLERLLELARSRWPGFEFGAQFHADPLAPVRIEVHHTKSMKSVFGEVGGYWLQRVDAGEVFSRIAMLADQLQARVHPYAGKLRRIATRPLTWRI